MQGDGARCSQDQPDCTARTRQSPSPLLLRYARVCSALPLEAAQIDRVETRHQSEAHAVPTPRLTPVRKMGGMPARSSPKRHPSRESRCRSVSARPRANVIHAQPGRASPPSRPARQWENPSPRSRAAIRDTVRYAVRRLAARANCVRARVAVSRARGSDGAVRPRWDRSTN